MIKLPQTTSYGGLINMSQTTTNVVPCCALGLCVTHDGMMLNAIYIFKMDYSFLSLLFVCFDCFSFYCSGIVMNFILVIKKICCTCYTSIKIIVFINGTNFSTKFHNVFFYTALILVCDFIHFYNDCKWVV